jgi:GNAT superfamily N-acetyltransferase
MGDFRSLGLQAQEPLIEKHDCSDFRCGKQSLDDWLKELALYNQRANYTRTFVVETLEMKVRAYYALCTGMIMRRNLRWDQGSWPSPEQIPVALLARFAVHYELQGQGIGMALLASALRNVVSASQVVAFRAVMVDALDQQAANFYKRVGFRETKISPLKLILPTQDIIASMNG